MDIVELDASIAVTGSTSAMYPQGKDILVVVHDPQRREQIACLLSDEGFTVTVAADGLAALRVCADRRFGLIVAATDLPGSLDGLGIVRRVRRRQPGMKFLYAGEPAARPALGNPDADDFIAVPFERHELIGCVYELLHRTVESEGADLGRRVRAEVRAS